MQTPKPHTHLNPKGPKPHIEIQSLRPNPYVNKLPIETRHLSQLAEFPAPPKATFSGFQAHKSSRLPAPVAPNPEPQTMSQGEPSDTHGNLFLLVSTVSAQAPGFRV